MFVHFNAQERTLGNIKALLESSGWHLVQIFASEGQANYYPQIVAKPSYVP